MRNLTDREVAHHSAYLLVDLIADKDLLGLADELQWFDLNGTVKPGGLLEQMAEVLQPITGGTQNSSFILARRAAAAWIINAFIELHS